jgi:transcriptional regulator with XRE-family HTH domain
MSMSIASRISRHVNKETANFSRYGLGKLDPMSGRKKGHAYKVTPELKAAITAYLASEDISETEMAARLGVSHGTVNNIRSGRTPASSYVPRIARLIRFKMPEESYPEDVRDLSAVLAVLHEDEPDFYAALKKQAEFAAQRKKGTPGGTGPK